MNKPELLIIHHTGGTDANPLEDTSNQTFSGVNEWHRQKWNFKSSLGYYIGYHYFIDKQGVVTQGRLDTDEGAHTVGKNLVSLGICLAGNFDLTMPTAAQIDALKKLCKEKMAQYAITSFNVVPHRKFANKTCYGKNLADDWAQKLVEETTSCPVTKGYDVEFLTSPTYLKYGASGEFVRSLQEFLKSVGVFPQEQECTGNYRDITARAVNDYCAKYGVEPSSIDGKVFGPTEIAKAIHIINKP